MNVIESMMRRGIDGSLIEYEKFQVIRQELSRQYMFVTFVIMCVVSFLATGSGFQLPGGLLIYAAWAVLAYTYMALGTEEAHRTVAGIGYVGGVIAVFYAAMFALGAMARGGLGGGGVLVVNFLVYSGLAALFLAAGFSASLAWRRLPYPEPQ